MLIGGSGNNVMLYKNNGSGEFTPAEHPFTGGAHVTYGWGDVNNDGNLDMVQSGFGGPPFADLFTSDNAGVFTKQASSPLPQMAPTIGIADLNNDGYQDVYVFGNQDLGRPKILFNNKQGGYTESSQFESYKFIDPMVSPVDYDNDGDLDLFVMATNVQTGGDRRFSRIFDNNGGTFTERNLNLMPKGWGSAVWGDYDSDGDLDLLLNGDGWLESGENNDNIYRLYRNDAGAFVAASTFQDYRQLSAGDGGRFADWDNDGDLDVIVTGWSHNQGRQATDIYLNNNGTFTAHSNNASIPGVSESAIEVADVDGDKDLDLIMTGFSGNNYNGANSAFSRNVSLVVVNPTTATNAAPSAPSNLRATLAGNGDITFAWNASTDDTTPSAALTYNLFVVGPNGKQYTYALADTTSGMVRTPGMGNVQLNKTWTLKGLPEGKYRWGVQAIDNSFVGSPFMKTHFTVSNGVLTKVADEKTKIAMVVYPNPSPGKVMVKFEEGKKYQVRVNTVDGRLVKEQAVAGTLHLDLRAGVYVLHVTDPRGGVDTRRIVVK